MASYGYLPLAADRWTPFVEIFRFRGIDLTDATLRAQVRLYPDAPGTPLVDLPTVTTANTEGLRLVEVTTDGLVPVSVVALRINEPTIEGLPFSGEPGDDLTLAWDMHITVSGLKQRPLAGPFIVRAGVTQA